MKDSETPLLEVIKVDVCYGYTQVLWDISMKINEGHCVSLVGLNGAGKSTLIKTISGSIRPKKGTITFMGKRIDHLNPWQIPELGIISVPEGRRILTKMTVKENLLLGCYSKKRRRKSTHLLEEVYKLFPVLKEREKQKAGTLSGGEQQMLAIARGLMSEPKLLILDEVTQGLAPKVRADIYHKIKEIKDLGVTMLLVDENAKKSLQISDYVYVLTSGRIVLSGDPTEIIKNKDFLKAFFGLS
jgi:branched-chain amino acid transport system ATP-binding protein